MKHVVIKPPTRKEQALIRRKIRQAVSKFGGLRPAARRLKIPPSYLGALQDGSRNNPGNDTLRRLGLRRITYIEEI